MVNDVRRRAPFYASDWRDAWDYRVVPATVYMYFAKYVFLSFIMTLFSVYLFRDYFGLFEEKKDLGKLNCANIVGWIIASCLHWLSL